MTEPTYIVRSEYRPDSESDTLPWRAEAERIADGHTFIGFGNSRENAIASVQSKIRAALADRQAERFDADENGDPIPSSLDAHRASRA